MKIYFQDASGCIKTRELVDLDGPPGFAAEVPPPPGFTRIPTEEGERLVTEHEHSRRRHLDRARADRDSARAADYAALIELGVPETTAARLTGHCPEPNTS